MLGNTIKALRKSKAWSQVHLTEAAGVSVRTIQRVERVGQCSDETLLSIAAALDVDVESLTQELPLPAARWSHRSQMHAQSFWPEVDPKKAAWWGGVLLGPSLLFVLSNVLKYHLGVPQLYDGLALLADVTGLAHFGHLLTSPALLLGGPVVAAVLNVLPQVHLWGDKTEKGFSLLGIDVSVDLASSLVLVGALGCIFVLLGYVTMENVAEWVTEIISR
ncbi:MAG: helix-turn-helix transcriptional regulator [Rhodothermales bacterium]